MDPQEIIEKIWPAVKRKHFFPELPTPKIADCAEKAAIEMKNKQITINHSFYGKMAGRMPGEDVIEALLDHGTSHYTYCPWDFNTHLALYSEAKKVVEDKEMVKKATSYFMDVVADTYCVKEKKTKIPELYKNLEKGKLDEVITSLYQRIWGIDLNISGHEDVVRRLSRIPYLDRGRWEESIRKFIRVIKPFLEAEQEQKGGGEQEQNPMGEHGLSGYSVDEIDRGLRDFANRGLEEFKEMVEDFEEELGEAGYSMEGGMGRGKGRAIDADILFYMKLAENFTIPIRKVPMEKSGSLHPHSHSPWEVGRPVQDIDIWTSFGKIMPGITQTWEKKEGEIFGELEGTPDCVIVIDSSGSMTNPRRRLSYAVLGAACACDAYLRNGSQVAVYNFSDAPAGGKEILDFTTERTKIYRVLCRYFGGGTALDLEDLEPLRRGNPDIFIITDMQITNLEKVIEYLTNIDSRVTAVHIGDNRYTVKFKKATEERQNISVYSVGRKEDIPKIVLGKVKDYFGRVL